MFIKALRNGLGSIIIFISWLTRPAKIKRSPEGQQQVDAAAAQLTLYQFRACPFCVKVRRQLHRLNAPVQIAEAAQGTEARQQLLEQGGKVKVPCLRIESAEGVQWMYESDAIISYLEQQFAAVA